MKETGIELKDAKICVIGLGYVGLPLAVEFGKKYNTVGFDINPVRIDELKKNYDKTAEVSAEELRSAGRIRYSNLEGDIRDYNIFIITVPTPVDKLNQPDMGALRKASEITGNVLKKGDLVIYESTVYPGATEEVCVPILESYSGLKYNIDFYCGYSPERINPGDKEHTITNIIKVTSGSTPAIADFVDQLYSSIIPAGTYMASSIRIAEAAKVIENAQRDINIAFVNELSKIFNLLEIDTTEVLQAAGTKWNFLPFKPGLVGGHCIGVDPYYLARKAQLAGYLPEIILAGRKLNDSMSNYVADELIRLLAKKQIPLTDLHVLIMGITFKKNCTDVRNSKVVDLIRALQAFKFKISILDPWADKSSVKAEYGLDIMNSMEESVDKQFDGIIMAVSHDQFREMDIMKLKKERSVLYDVMGELPRELIDGRL